LFAGYVAMMVLLGSIEYLCDWFLAVPSFSLSLLRHAASCHVVLHACFACFGPCCTPSSRQGPPCQTSIKSLRSLRSWVHCMVGSRYKVLSLYGSCWFQMFACGGLCQAFQLYHSRVFAWRWLFGSVQCTRVCSFGGHSWCLPRWCCTSCPAGVMSLSENACVVCCCSILVWCLCPLGMAIELCLGIYRDFVAAQIHVCLGCVFMLLLHAMPHHGQGQLLRIRPDTCIQFLLFLHGCVAYCDVMMPAKVCPMMTVVFASAVTWGRY